jgi:hypothetical protein
MDLPLKKATKKQLASGTAPICVRAPAKYWFGPDIWPDIAEAAIQKDWSPSGIVMHLKATAAGAARFQGLTRSTVWKWFDHPKKTGRSPRVLTAVESEKCHRVVRDPLGHPRMFVGVRIHLFANTDHTFEGEAP